MSNVLCFDSYLRTLEKTISESRCEVVIISAFVTHVALKWIHERCPVGVDVIVVARWTRADLQSGASDFDSYFYARDVGINFFIHKKLHAKMILVDERSLFIGSANVTGGGFGLNSGANLEASTQIIPNRGDLDFVNQVIRSAFLLTDNYVDKLRAEVEVFSSNSKVFDEIELFGEDTRLRLSDCPLLGPRKLKFVSENHGDHKWTCECLKIRHNNLTDEYLRRQFLRSRVYKWIDEKLNEHGSMSFGHVSSVLHGELADDPTPFRREVKIVVSSLFEWLEFVDLGAIKMVMHNHTISICKSV